MYLTVKCCNTKLILVRTYHPLYYHTILHNRDLAQPLSACHTSNDSRKNQKLGNYSNFRKYGNDVTLQSRPLGIRAALHFFGVLEWLYTFLEYL